MNDEFGFLDPGVDDTKLDMPVVRVPLPHFPIGEDGELHCERGLPHFVKGPDCDEPPAE